MLLSENAKMAWGSLKNARWRSLLTMLGIIIGVASVITIVSLGEGLKHQVKEQAGGFGSDLISVRPGQFGKRDANGAVIGVDPAAAFGSGTLSEQDLNTVQNTTEISAASPLGLLPTTIETGGRQKSASVMVTTSALPTILHQKTIYGGFWNESENDSKIAVLGKLAAEQIFGDSLPIGQTFRWRGQNFLVRGIFDQFPASPLLPATDFNRAIFVPYGAAKNVLSTAPPVPLIVATAKPAVDIEQATAHLRLNLTSAHGGQEDFTVLKQSENTLPTQSLARVVGQAVVGIATVSLIMGGAGIMNIMLVAVTERTREIGIRKAIGANNGQILSQFLVESAVLSLVGAGLGVVVAFVAELGFRIFTSLQPVITLGIVGLTVSIALAIGLLFGILPAFQAARKDPIDALRYE